MRAKTEFEVIFQTMRFILSASSRRARVARRKSDKLPHSLKHSVSSKTLRHSVRSDMWVSMRCTIVRPKSVSLPLPTTSVARLHVRLLKHQATQIQQTFVAFLSLRQFGQLVGDGGVVGSLVSRGLDMGQSWPDACLLQVVRPLAALHAN